jgi:ABC-type amino acid transport system permease subunit
MISEPMTLATDYLLAAVTAFLAVGILRRTEGQNARRLWGVAFLALALGAALGGTHHGFEFEALWKPTVWTVGLASAVMLAGSAFATTHGRARHALLALALVKLVAFWAWTWRDDRFIWVVADTAAAFALVAALHLWRWRQPGSLWIVAGVGVSITGAAVQASGFDVHRHFNHNDLYHLIQIGAMLAYYRGARILADRQ